MNASLPIGVFDSGIGGLTVLKALMARLPGESFLYLGDTARLPYGTKTAGTVERYALQAVDELTRRGVKALVIACNTASAAALPALQAAHPELPIIGVIEPGAEAAVAATKTGRIAVLATEGTVRGGAYQREILKRMPRAVVAAIPATLFVALAEEGWTQGEVAAATARRYLSPVLAEPHEAPDVLVLGCTHFPPLADVIQREAGAGIRIVDSAVTTAEALARLLVTRQLAAPAGGQATCRFLVTDGEERFARVGPLFLGRSIAASGIERVDLQVPMGRTGSTQEWVDRYNASHQHPVNRSLHAVGIPVIFVSLLLGLGSIFIAGLWLPALLLFVLGWVLQFIGHLVEGKPPAFFSDWRFLVTGLAWWVRKFRGRQKPR